MDEGVFTRVGRNLAEAVVTKLEDMTRIITPGRLLNISICPANCTFPQGKCVNGSCVCEVRNFSVDICIREGEVTAHHLSVTNGTYKFTDYI